MNPAQKLEQAAANFLANVATPLTGVNIYKGVENTIAIDGEESNTQPQTRQLPAVTLVAEGMHGEQVPRTKAFRGILAVRVEADAHNTTDAAFDALCDTVFSKFDIQTLKGELSSENFTCGYARIVDNGHAIKYGDNWENTIRIDCLYYLSDGG